MGLHRAKGSGFAGFSDPTDTRGLLCGFWGSGACGAQNCLRVSGAQQGVQKRATEAQVTWTSRNFLETLPVCCSPVPGRCLVVAGGVPLQGSVLPGTPAEGVPLARSSPDVGSQVQGG